MSPLERSSPYAGDKRFHLKLIRDRRILRSALGAKTRVGSWSVLPLSNAKKWHKPKIQPHPPPGRRFQCGSEQRVSTTKRNGESFGAAIRNFTRRICRKMSPPPLGDGSSRRSRQFCAASPSKRAGCRDSPIRRRAREPSLRPHMLSGGSFVDPAACGVADFGAWRAPRGEGAILPIEPCDGKSDRQRRSPSLYRSILWSGDRTCETPKS